MRERLRNWSLSVCTACSVCICAVFIAWRGNVCMRRKRKTELLCKRWGVGGVQRSRCGRDIFTVNAQSFDKVVATIDDECHSLAVHFIIEKLLGDFFQAKECVAPLLPPIFTYVHSFTRFFYKKKRGSQLRSSAGAQ